MTKQSTQQNKPDITSSSLASEVLHRIESENITPTAWWRFVCINCLVWVAWALTVVVGSISVAVLLYVGNRSRFELFEATHDTLLAFLLEILPFVWVLTFIVMVFLAYVNMRHTKCGYRYNLWKMLGSSVAVSVGLGVILQIFGGGYLIDTQFGKVMPAYTSFERMEMKLWQMPNEGRLVGILEGVNESINEYTIRDTNGKIWTILTTELRDSDMDLLKSGHEIRMVGTTTDIENNIFYACGIFPWDLKKKITTNHLRMREKNFKEKMSMHMKRKSDEGSQPYKKNHSSTFEDGSICAELDMVKRLAH